jgi:transcriptional regulator with GAF, ATPase, and Fis domain
MAPFAAQLGHASLDEILRQAARDIETACIDAALLQSGGDPEQAARLLQTDPEDLQARRARLS